ncbi:MAG: hypothetical protein AB2989_02550 [Candidatus Symbiodolus clandestinus]
MVWLVLEQVYNSHIKGKFPENLRKVLYQLTEPFKVSYERTNLDDAILTFSLQDNTNAFGQILQADSD